MRGRTAKDSGFTLVEILCVLVVIGLMSSVVVLSIPQPKSELEKQAALLSGQLNALAQDGMISGSVTAAGFSEDGYALYAFENSEWTEKAAGEWQDSYRLTLSRASAKLDMPKTTEPIILFQPTGLSTPFELTLSDRETKYALLTAGDGRVDLIKSVP
ncbi:prepilin-type N-terminal cleavage/methylation domain-containing protein [Hellea balneolensis]|uniref:prepilin-type N-terminal cleavage/methylation domain-containing protein n=1 Tax=Hellea balneolensis TaxID=287478 RepID=UPI00040CFCBA|nr:prepilin-type N-terminal cleavage/methylation domain-containing protein [Hellea balneolensis]